MQPLDSEKLVDLQNRLVAYQTMLLKVPLFEESVAAIKERISEILIEIEAVKQA